MRSCTRLIVPTLLALGLLPLKYVPTFAADPEIDRLLRSPVAKDWITNGGNLTNHCPNCHSGELTPAFADEEFLDGHRRIHFPALN